MVIEAKSASFHQLFDPKKTVFVALQFVILMVSNASASYLSYCVGAMIELSLETQCLTARKIGFVGVGAGQPKFHRHREEATRASSAFEKAFDSYQVLKTQSQKCQKHA
jgi:hypothetical protein